MLSKSGCFVVNSALKVSEIVDTRGWFNLLSVISTKMRGAARAAFSKLV
jgi:hypothetical protein